MLTVLLQSKNIETNPGLNTSDMYDLRYLLLQNGDIETNPGPNKSKIRSNEKYNKDIKTLNKNRLLMTLVMLIQILVLIKGITQITINIETRTPGNNNTDIKIGIIYIVIHRASMICKQNRLCFWHKKKTKINHKTHMAVLISLLLLVGGDIELNPGPNSIYLCGICEQGVNDSHRAFCCDGCDIWYHKSYISICTQDFEYLENRSISYICYKCNVPNYISNLHLTHEVDTTNLLDPLRNISENSISPNNNPNRNFIPKYHSSPKGIPKARIPAIIKITDPMEQNDLLSDTENKNYNLLEVNMKSQI